MNAPLMLRKECPPGACICRRDALLGAPGADIRVLRLTKDEEKRLIARIDQVSTLAQLHHLQARMHELLGIVVTITPSPRGVRTVRGFTIRLQEQDGLCRQTRQNIPAAIRRCLERHPEIAHAILDAGDLLGG